MKHSIYRRWRLSFMAVGLMVIMQFVAAAQACVIPAFVASSSTAMVECDGMPMDGAACLIHCQKGTDQLTSADPASDLLAIPSPGFWARGLAPPQQTSGRTRILLAARRSCGPPLQILFCSFQA